MENQDEKINSALDGAQGGVSNRTNKWLPGVTGGVASAIITAILLVIPVINTWLENTKQIQLQQIKNTAEQVEYITKRMVDSDKERDLYKKEMLDCQHELRNLKKG